MAERLVEFWDAEYDQESLIAAALVHDASNLVEFTGPKDTATETGNALLHAQLAGVCCLEEGLSPEWPTSSPTTGSLPHPSHSQVHGIRDLHVGRRRGRGSGLHAGVLVRFDGRTSQALGGVRHLLTIIRRSRTLRPPPAGLIPNEG